MSSSEVGVEGSPSTLLHASGGTAGQLVDTQRSNPQRHIDAINAVQHDTQRRLLWALVQHDGRVSYTDLNDVTTTTQRTTRKHVSNLVEDGLVRRVDANFTFLEFHDTDAEILTREALRRWYDATGA